MSAERMPPTDDSLLSAPLAWLTRAVLRAPKAVVIGAVVLAVAAIGLAIFGLEFRTSRLDLLNPDSAYNKLWLDYLDEFGEGDDVVIVVQADSRDEVTPVLDELAQRLGEDSSQFDAVLHKVELANVRAKGLHFLDANELQQIESALDHIDPVIHGDWSQLRVDRQLAMASQAPGEQLPRLSASLSAAFDGVEGEYTSPWPLAGERLATLHDTAPEYLLANDGRIGFVLLRLAKQQSGFTPGTAAIDRLRTLIAQSEARHPGVRVGLTGLPVMESDEMRGSQGDMLKASLISLVGVACLFMAGLGGVRHPLLTVLTLLLAMAWSFGYITLAVGHLNILSVSFGVILIGLGIDFGIHYVARYLQLRRDENDSSTALIGTARSVGPGVVTGAVTTAIAFFTAYFTNFAGVAELGVIAGGGILLCLAGALIVLPAMILLSDGNANDAAPSQPLRIDRWIAPLSRFHGLTLPTGILITGVLTMGISQVAYDHNLLNLQPAGLESVDLERQLLSETDQSVWYAVSVADSRDELLRRKDEFSRLASVDRAEEIVSLLPAEDPARAPIIASIHQRLENLPQQPPLIPVGQPADVAQAMAIAAAEISKEQPGGRSARRQLEQTSVALARMDAQSAFARISGYQQQLADDLLDQLHTLHAVADPEPPALDDLPPSLVSRFVGKNNRHLLKIYGKGDIWDMAALETFVTDVKSVDPKSTGQPLQTYYASRQMQRSYVLAALYALGAVAVALLLDLRSIAMTLLAVLPVMLGMLQMFGLMGLAGIPLNPANMIVLPLILGIGLDDGVHVIHDFRRQRGGYRLSSSTATAVLVTSMTTMVGVGSLMIASHQGLQSLGRVLTIGVTCCMVSSLVILPALLHWLGKDDKTNSPPQDVIPDQPTPIQPKRRAA